MIDEVGDAFVKVSRLRTSPKMFSFQTPRSSRKAQTRKSPLSTETQPGRASASTPYAEPATETVQEREIALAAAKPVDVPQYWTRNNIRSLSVLSPLPVDALDAVERAGECPLSGRVVVLVQPNLTNCSFMWICSLKLQSSSWMC